MKYKISLLTNLQSTINQKIGIQNLDEFKNADCKFQMAEIVPKCKYFVSNRERIQKKILIWHRNYFSLNHRSGRLIKIF